MGDDPRKSLTPQSSRLNSVCASAWKRPRALAARYDRRVSRVMVSLSNGLELAFPSHLTEGLADAKPAELAAIKITPTGLGLH